MGKDSHGCARIEEISGVAYSGFIPFQDGGFEVSEFYSNGWSCGSYFTDLERTSTEEHYKYMLECFARDVLSIPIEDCEKWGKDFDHDTMTLDHQRKFEDYESEGFDSVLLRLEMWVESVKEDESPKVMFRLSINYVDAPYYRSKHDETLFQITLNYIEVMGESPKDIINQLTTEKEKDNEKRI